MQNNIKVWIESSTLSFDLNSHDEGVYLISDLDGLTSLPSIRTSAGVNAGTDGGWTSAQAFDARLISLSVVIANEDVSIVESKRRLLNSLLAQSRKETLKLHFTTEAGMEFIINVRITAVTGALTNILKKQELLIQMRADDPIIYGAQGGEGADATLLVQQTQSGFEIPFEIPLLIGGGSDKVDVEDLGTEEVYPIIKMTGPLHNPTVVNETQNAEIGINADLGDMEWRGYQSAELLGNATQKTLSGKNLINLANAGTTSNGITTTFSNNTAHIANTATSSWANITAVQTGVSFLAGNYTFSIDHTLTFAIRFRATYADSTSEDFSISAGSKSVSFTTTKEITRFYIFIEGFSVGATLNETIDIMLEAGSTATPYEQWCGGIPAPNPDFPQVVNTVSGEQTVKITGKNITHNTLIAQQTTVGGVAVIPNDDGTISLNGTATSSVWVNIDNIVLPAGANIAHIGNTTQSTTAGGYTFSVRIENGDINFAYNGTNHYVSIYLWSGQTYTNAKVYVQIEAGDTATPFEPYQAQRYSINLGGQNLFDRANASENKVLIWTTGELNDENKSIVGDYISASEGQQFSANYNAFIFCYDSSKTYLGTIQTGGTTIAKVAGGSFSSFTIPSGYGVAYIRVEFRSNANSSLDMTQQDIMLNYGSTALPYAPYTTYAYELAKIGTYQDYIYKSGDKWYKHAEIGKFVFNGTEPWAVANTGTANFYYRRSNLYLDWTGSITTLRSNYGSYGPVGNSNTDIGIILTQANHNEVRIRYGTEMTADAWKAKLSGTNMVLYYAMPTATDTQITDAELVGQLDALLNYAPWYGDDQNVFLIPSAGADGTLVLGAHNEPKPADEVLIDTHLKTVTLNGQNAYPLLKDGSSFFSLAPGDNIMYLTSDVASDTGKAEIKFKQGFISI